ncbi:hypothetical protein Nepgr_027815 [Nepenthes gracilis]|uniref:Uncharacterized protein n=1 Tax=Nepenthes gracilis TaxID=150966 RepID=A0AAD3TAR9_NEPGR|nr:hypothetical protein Nepgr_027815 [Nepenthes gracilis]
MASRSSMLVERGGESRELHWDTSECVAVLMELLMDAFPSLVAKPISHQECGISIYSVRSGGESAPR